MKLRDGVLEKWGIDLSKYELWVDTEPVMTVFDTCKKLEGIESDAEFARLLGITKQTLSQQRKADKLHRTAVINYMDKLGVDPKKVLAGKKERVSLSKDALEMIEAFPSPRLQKKMVKYADHIKRLMEDLE